MVLRPNNELVPGITLHHYCKFGINNRNFSPRVQEKWLIDWLIYWLIGVCHRVSAQYRLENSAQSISVCPSSQGLQIAFEMETAEKTYLSSTVCVWCLQPYQSSKANLSIQNRRDCLYGCGANKTEYWYAIFMIFLELPALLMELVFFTGVHQAFCGQKSNTVEPVIKLSGHSREKSKVTIYGRCPLNTGQF